MYRVYYAERDTTLYERHPEQNTGIDQILDLEKIASSSRMSGVIQKHTTNTRILLDFGSEINRLKQSIADGEMPALSNQNITSASVFLSLKTTDANDLLTTYSIEAYPISQSWDNGNGRFDNTPKTKIGSSWFNRSGDAVAQTGIAWNIADAASSGSSIGVKEKLGGGTWITGSGYEASQSFQNESPDVRMDVTDIVKKWTDETITNNGFIVKRPYADEIDGEVRGSIKFFGRESHTIFVPRLEVCWDDSSRPNSGSAVTSSLFVPYFKNIKAEYRPHEIARFRIGCRPEFPSRTYQTTSFYITNNLLPLSSSYQIYDEITNDIIIKDDSIGSGKTWNDSKTKISTDSDGSYFDIRMDSFMPERYYKIKLTCRRANDIQTFDDYYFKVVR
tara:strand:- start:1590 stop:2759 length:1170 start_codon:yes stop_codon:yes gene_type:complete